MTFEVSDGIPLSKKRARDAADGELCSRIVDTGRSSVFRDCLERVHCEILLPIILHPSSPRHQRQRRAPLSPILFPGVAPSASFYPIVPFCSALAALADSSISRWARARKEIKSTLMVFAISRHCVRAHHVRKYGSERGAFPRAFERIVIVWHHHRDYNIFRP